MFYQIKISISGVTSWIELNKTKEEVLYEYICPFINNEVREINNKLTNFSSYGSLTVFQTSKPVDSDWPVIKQPFTEKGEFGLYEYRNALDKKLEESEMNVTKEIYVDALSLIESRQYVEGRKKHLKLFESKFCFFICPFGNEEVDHNYEFAIKPLVEKHSFEIKRADEINHTGLITGIIIESINKSKFLIADLSEEKPNCYYEIGYAHSLGKPVIIIAKTGTRKHFDITAYKWVFYDTYKDLKISLEKEINALIEKV